MKNDAMILNGKNCEAKIFTNNVDDTTIAQISNVLDQEFARGANVRIMPDCHAGKGAVIGTTMKVTDKVVPNLVGVDIGCGMLCVELESTHIDFEKLDSAIRKFVPSGIEMRETPHVYTQNLNLQNVIANFSMEKALLSLGTLGGGNHFIEINQSEDGKLYLVIHSGSRHLGVKVANYHQKRAIEQLNNGKEELKELINSLKVQGRQSEIQDTIKNFKEKTPTVPNDLAYVTGPAMDDYLHDLKIAQDFAKWNRAAMANVILDRMGFVEVSRIDTVHNYIDYRKYKRYD